MVLLTTFGVPEGVTTTVWVGTGAVTVTTLETDLEELSPIPLVASIVLNILTSSDARALASDAILDVGDGSRGLSALRTSEAMACASDEGSIVETGVSGIDI